MKSGSQDQSGGMHQASGVRVAPGVVVPESALRFATARSSGPGGQNVNKVETKVELRVSMEDLPIPGWAKRRLMELEPSRVVGVEEFVDETGARRYRGGELVVVSQEERSQSRNKEACVAKLREMLLKALVKPKPRKKTKPSRASKERRLEEKKRRGEIKRGRGGAE